LIDAEEMDMEVEEPAEPRQVFQEMEERSIGLGEGMRKKRLKVQKRAALKSAEKAAVSSSKSKSKKGSKKAKKPKFTGLKQDFE
jgi:hypothetical protein